VGKPQPNQVVFDSSAADLADYSMLFGNPEKHGIMDRAPPLRKPTVKAGAKLGGDTAKKLMSATRAKVEKKALNFLDLGGSLGEEDLGAYWETDL